MNLREHDMSDSSQSSSSVFDGERSQHPVRGREISLSSRVRGIDCMLADIEAQIQKLQQEKIHLSLMREGLTGKLSTESRHESGL